ncbi:MAG: hypothetical protein LIO40_02535 [Ruminococcus sp.]|nr:hypothetical protein [Ruminococcus sp.]
MDFSQFKIEGRTSGKLNALETYMYYMVRPECRDEARFRLLRSLEESGSLTFK